MVQVFTEESNRRISNAVQKVERQTITQNPRKHKRRFLDSEARSTIGIVASGVDIANGATGDCDLATGTAGSETASTDTVTAYNATGVTVWADSTVILEWRQVPQSTGGGWTIVDAYSATIAYGTASGDVSEGATGNLTSVTALNGNFTPTTITAYRVIEGSVSTSEKVLVHWNEAAGERQHFCCEGSGGDGASDDVYFRISSADTGGATNYWADKVVDFGSGTFSTNEDFAVDYQINNAASDETVTLFIDSSEIANHGSSATELLGHDGTTKRWFNFADGYVHDGTDDIKVAADTTTTLGEMQHGVDVSTITGFTAIGSVDKILGARGSGAPQYWTFETSPGQTDPSPQVARDTTADWLMSWFVSASDDKFQIFLDASQVTGYTAAHPENLAHNSSGEKVYRNYANFQSTPAYNSSDDIPILMDEEGANKETARLYFRPDEVPDTHDGANSTSALASVAGTSFIWQRIDAAGARASLDATAVASTTFVDVNIISTGSTNFDDATVDTTNENIALERNGMWLLIANGNIETTIAAGSTQYDSTLQIRFRDQTNSISYGLDLVDTFTLGTTAVRVQFSISALVEVTATTDFGVQIALASGTTSITLNGGRFHAIWCGDLE